MQRWYDSRTPEQRARVVFYTMLGSHNQNDRSFVSDGEDAIILSHWPAVIPYLDLISIIGQSRWIDDPKELDAFLPQHSDVVVRLAHWFKVIF